MDEKQILSSLIVLAEDTVDLLTETRKWERECWVCSKLLKALQINVSQNDFVKPSAEPPDVICRGANFEVYIVLDKDRRLDADWKHTLSRYRNSQSLEGLLEPYRPPKKISAAQIVELLRPTLSKKRENYANRGISLNDIDILAYVNLRESTLDLETPFPAPNEFHQQGWRSISIFGNSYCRVLYAEESAPDFLRLHAKKTITIKQE